MRPKACSLSQCRNGIIMEENRAPIQFNYPNCIMNVKEEIVCIPKRKVSQSSPSTPLGTYPGSIWSPSGYNRAFVLRKLGRFVPCWLVSYLLNPSFILHNQNAGAHQAVFIRSVNCHVYNSLLVLLQSTKEQLEKTLLGRGETFARYKSTIIKFILFGGKMFLRTFN